MYQNFAQGLKGTRDTEPQILNLNIGIKDNTDGKYVV